MTEITVLGICAAGWHMNIVNRILYRMTACTIETIPYIMITPAVREGKTVVTVGTVYRTSALDALSKNSHIERTAVTGCTVIGSTGHRTVQVFKHGDSVMTCPCAGVALTKTKGYLVMEGIGGVVRIRSVMAVETIPCSKTWNHIGPDRVMA